MQPSERLTGAIFNFLGQRQVNNPIVALQNRLPARAVIYILGGALRNVLIKALHSKGPPTADVDLFIGNIEAGFDLAKVLKGERHQPTDLGGVRWRPQASPLAFDLCLLPQFVVIAKYGLEPSWQTLLASVDFNVNAILYDCTAHQLRERHCIAGLRAKSMTFNTERFYDRTLLAYRVLVVRHKIGFSLAQPVYAFVKTLDLETIIRVKAVLAGKLSHDQVKAVTADLNCILTSVDYASYLSQAQSRW